MTTMTGYIQHTDKGWTFQPEAAPTPNPGFRVIDTEVLHEGRDDHRRVFVEALSDSTSHEVPVSIVSML